MSFKIGDASMFEYRYSDSTSEGCDVYGLIGSNLNAKECHMFYPVQLCEEQLLATALEYIVFNPNNKVMNDKYNFSLVKCGTIDLCWVSFPKEFQDVCERAAKLFGMTMESRSRAIADGEGRVIKTILKMPKQENIFIFKTDGKRCDDPKKIKQQIDNFIWVGNSIEKNVLD